jgi:integrase
VSRTKPRDHAYRLWDLQVHGLVLRVWPTGRKVFYVSYRSNRRGRWLHLGDANILPLSTARELAQEALLAVIKGGDPAADKKAKLGALTFGQLVERYVEEYAKKRNRSWKQSYYLLRKFVLPHWKDLPAEGLKRSDTRALIGPLTGPTLGNQVFGGNQRALQLGLQDELSNHPCRGVERAPRVSRERVLADSELPLFWSAFAEAGIPGAALQMLLMTAQRPGEVAAMRWQDIQDNWWTLPGKADATWPGTKNAQTHRVYLPQPAQDILLQLGPEASGYVFEHPPRLAVVMRR